MAGWSRLLLLSNQKFVGSNGLLGKSLLKSNYIVPKESGSLVRCMSEHRVMDVTASRWQWHKTKDWMHFYFFMGAIPVVIVVFLTNIFVGPATLEEIPEGYVPKHWEYYRHPITRFMARYCFTNPQQEYETFLHYAVTAFEKKHLYELERKVKRNLEIHNDYPFWTYNYGFSARLVREARERIDKLETIFTD